MNQTALTKVKAAKAAEVCKHFELKDEARRLLSEGMSPREFVDALLTHRQNQPAIQFMAHALPPREGIWWACLCLEHVNQEKWSPPEREACKAVVRWVLEPSEENRQATKAPGEAAGAGTPAGSLALAASWTGGSMTPANLPPVAPGPFLPAKGVAAAVGLAAVRADPTKIADTQRRYVELALEVAQGSVTWPDPKKILMAKI
jgi:hypothetical protein